MLFLPLCTRWAPTAKRRPIYSQRFPYQTGSSISESNGRSDVSAKVTGLRGKGAIPGGKAAVMENTGHQSLSLMVLPQTEHQE